MKKITLIGLVIIIILVILAIIKSRQTSQSDGYPCIESPFVADWFLCVNKQNYM